MTELAKYVSDSMGGPILKTGMFGFELSASKIQVEQQLNLLPLGEVSRGVFQHRALLFKVRLNVKSNNTIFLASFLLVVDKTYGIRTTGMTLLFIPSLGRFYVTRLVLAVP